MTILPAPQTAFPKGSAHRLTTAVPKRLKRYGYIPTRPLGAVVVDVAGVPSDALVPLGTTVAYDTADRRLYRRTGEDVWEPVAGTPEGA